MKGNDEAEWVSCQVPRVLLLGLEELGKQGLISRELRLFSCACCRRVSEFISDDRSWRAVEVAEQYTDGNASWDELKVAYTGATLAVQTIKERIKQIHSAAETGVSGQDTEGWRLFSIENWHPLGRQLNAAFAARLCAESKVITSNVDLELKYCGDWLVTRASALYAYMAGASRDRLETMETAFLSRNDDYLTYEDGWQADLVRCIFRDPFRTISADELDVESGIREMAESIYRLRAFNAMPSLGKELKVYGRKAADATSHCIDARVHSRGCWALDLVRGFNRIPGKKGQEGGRGQT